MSAHDWTRVDEGVFHHFHHAWIEEITRALNSGLLPSDYYALAEQHSAGFGPDVLTLQDARPVTEWENPVDGSTGGVLLAEPKIALTAESDLEFYRRKKNIIAVRHVSGDHLIAVVEILSRGNKSSNGAMRSFVEKGAAFIDQGIHLLIVDLHPPGKHDPQGIHAAIWYDLTDQMWTPPSGRPLTQVAYEVGAGLRAYCQPFAVDDSFAEMPLFLSPRAHVPVPLEVTYLQAFAALPRRWRSVLEK